MGAWRRLGPDLRGQEEIAADGLFVLPGGVDPHVHLSPSVPVEEAPPWVDDFWSGTRAAAAGGITTVGNMTFPWGEADARRGDGP